MSPGCAGRRRRLEGALVLIVAGLFAWPALAAQPVGFACSKPIVAVWENEAKSRYGILNDERVFDVKVEVAADPQGDSIAVTDHQKGVCRVLLPVGDYFTQPMIWREARAEGEDHGAYQSLNVYLAGGAGSNRDWILIKPKKDLKPGLATIEFHLFFNRPYG